ncbi:Methyltransferase-like protein 4 [Aspergillus hancockii]|nr:Methyltransferase-like protein 4 [Aspergillus hancockii]
MTTSSILYQNTLNTTFLIDIPTSIALAQEVSPSQQTSAEDPSKLALIKSFSKALKATNRRHLVSSTPLKVPYAVSTEPKTNVARARVLQRIPVSERAFHDAVLPLVKDALHEIRVGLGAGDEWCLQRKTLVYDCAQENAARGAQGAATLGKRSRKARELTGGGGCRFPVDNYADSITYEKSTELEGASRDPEPGNPPLIISPGLNSFGSMSSLCNTVARNTSFEHAMVKAPCGLERPDTATGSEYADRHYHAYHIPPLSSFLLCNLPISQLPVKPNRSTDPIPGLPRNQKFDLILLDPPWLNRSVRRSGHYHTQSYLEGDLLTQRIRDILRVHLHDSHYISPCDNAKNITSAQKPAEKQYRRPIAAIWITNSGKARKTAYDAMRDADLSVYEEWVWIKTTTEGDPIMPLDGLWRKPYEVLVIGKKQFPQLQTDPLREREDVIVTRRFIAAVPDVHSRKPNLREIFEKIFFDGAYPSRQSEDILAYSALEVFARNVTAGWWACGDEALMFNSEEWWVHGDQA